MANEAKAGSAPVWQRVLVSLVAVLILAIGAGILWIESFVRSGQEVTNPREVKRLAGEIAIIRDPLPEGFSYNSAVVIPNAGKTIAVEHKPDGLQLSLMLVQVPNQMDAEQQADFMATSGASALRGSPKIIVESKGTLLVAGTPMAFRLGSTTAQDGTRFSVLVGAIVSGDRKRTIRVNGYSSSPKFDMPEARKFLDSIQSFF